MNQDSPVITVQHLRDQIAGLEAEQAQAVTNHTRAEGALTVLRGMLAGAERVVIVENEKIRQGDPLTMATAHNEVCCPHPGITECTETQVVS